jgi:hypothetical protein
MDNSSLAILISLVSLLVAAFSLLWSVYKDIVLKPRLKVRFSVQKVVGGPLQSYDVLTFSATNFGPGKIRCEMLQLKSESLWRKFINKRREAVLLNDNTNPYATKLPCILDVTERGNFFIPFNESCFLNEQFTHIGVSDSYGRVHWTPKKQVDEAKKIFRKEFKK